MPALASLGNWLSPNSVSIFKQQPGSQFVQFLLTRLDVPAPDRVRFDLTLSEDFERSFELTRNPVEKITAQNRVRNPDRLSVSGILSSNPLESLLSRAGLVRLHKMELAKLRKIIENEICFIVTPERSYSNMSCVSFRESYPEDIGNGVLLSLSFEEVRIVGPLLVASAFDPELANSGTNGVTNLGNQTPDPIADPFA